MGVGRVHRARGQGEVCGETVKAVTGGRGDGSLGVRGRDRDGLTRHPKQILSPGVRLQQLRLVSQR